MRFVDANVFIYALLKPRKEPPENVKQIKDRAKNILSRISEGERATTTVVHLSEVANVLESRASKSLAAEFIRTILTGENIEVLDVSPGDYLKASLMAEEMNIGVNDALAYVKMQELGIKEIYTFDRDFERLNVRIVRE
ncbi:putative nucleic acid-binding protein, containing PIN domain [Thermococcus barophilus]|uniref:Ribonuclease VapC n=2 Tax=Thermococcus barophilus TaxID=55802 RepID=A0A0S1XBV6_THEBA|nr:type II toxin-antitoxin system VapC family toxin [Thermococcus barophilus]ALM75262.1 putative nucleic acid-binding protein, containing PIN domain [Thermococcus barophilus]